jgi:hypothetical protein
MMKKGGVGFAFPPGTVLLGFIMEIGNFAER